MDKTIHIEVDADSGKVMTLTTVTETIGIEIPRVKEVLIGVEDGIIMAEAKDTVIVAEGEDGIPISNITIQCTNKNTNFLIQIITGHHQWVINIDTQSHMGQYSYPQQQQYPPQIPSAPSQQATNVCQLCNSQGHYDYQCQFAGDFMARTQKAFNQGRSYSHQDPNHGEWSQGDTDNKRP